MQKLLLITLVLLLQSCAQQGATSVSDSSILPSDIKDYSVSSSETCILTYGGEISCTYHDGEFYKVKATSTYSSFTMTQDYICGLTGGGDIECTGFISPYKDYAPDFEPDIEPIKIASGYRFKKLFASYDKICGIDSSDKLYCLGRSINSSLGDGTTAGSISMKPISHRFDFAHIALNWENTCAITKDYMTVCWGNIDGQEYLEPTLFLEHDETGVSDHTFLSLNSGKDGSTYCGLQLNGELKCWGDGYWGQLGNGTSDNTFRPTKVIGAERYQWSYIDLDAVCGIDTFNNPYCWGCLPLMDCNNTTAKAPIAISKKIQMKSIKATWTHGCGLSLDGKELYCWGDLDGTDQHELTRVDFPR